MSKKLTMQEQMNQMHKALTLTLQKVADLTEGKAPAIPLPKTPPPAWIELQHRVYFTPMSPEIDLKMPYEERMVPRICQKQQHDKCKAEGGKYALITKVSTKKLDAHRFDDKGKDLGVNRYWNTCPSCKGPKLLPEIAEALRKVKGL